MGEHKDFDDIEDVVVEENRDTCPDPDPTPEWFTKNTWDNMFDPSPVMQVEVSILKHIALANLVYKIKNLRHIALADLKHEVSHYKQRRTFIQTRTVLKVVDKEAHPNGKVKKGKVVYGVVVRAAMQRGRCDGSGVKFDDNAMVLVDKQGQPISTRVFAPVPHELRKRKHVKILTLAEHIA
nr:50s ribosomal protein hlp, mitochondrial [Quercus suber]